MVISIYDVNTSHRLSIGKIYGYMKSNKSLQSNESLQAAQSILASFFNFETKIDEKFDAMKQTSLQFRPKFGYDHATDITSATATSCPKVAATSSRDRLREV